MWLAAVDSSTIVAFCWVALSMLLIASLTSRIAFACSAAPDAIWVTKALISETCPVIRYRATPVSVTSRDAASTPTSRHPMNASEGSPAPHAMPSTDMPGPSLRISACSSALRQLS